jgi:hypothetical protein
LNDQSLITTAGGVATHLSPSRFAEYRDYHAGADIIVCGCGMSLAGFSNPERYITIGVNDVGRLFQPNYLVVVNQRAQFQRDRFHYIETSNADALFTHLNLGVPHPNVVRFGLGRRGGTELEGQDRLPFTRNSPYIAVCLALHMGARRVGLLGVDFADHHFFGATGVHPLTRELSVIDGEYGRLAEAWIARDVEIVNLSPVSRLVSLPKISLEAFADPAHPDAATAAIARPGRAYAIPAVPRVFVVNYRFLTAGDVFANGLRHAAQTLSIPAADADWDDPALAAKISTFGPDLLFVVHGRRYARLGRDLAPSARTAVWLLDEPYEVDETASWSERFDAVFVNDPSTLERHRNAHYLPVAFDPSRHHPGSRERPHTVGFIGGYNSAREAMLLRLLDEGLLSYVVGGPWRSARLRAICRADNILAEQAAALYRQTRLVINVFRERHHYNHAAIPAQSCNPRIYEAIACGALVVSERRSEVGTVFPDLPLFDTADELVGQVRRLLVDDAAYRAARDRCMDALVGHSYADRLSFVIEVMRAVTPVPRLRPTITRPPRPPAPRTDPPNGWIAVGNVTLRSEDAALALRAPSGTAGGSEVGLASAVSYTDLRLSFELTLVPGSVFIAKLHQVSQTDQTTNSYHLVIDGRRAFVAMHNRVLHRLRPVPAGRLTAQMEWIGGELGGRVGDQELPAIDATALGAGFCFVGLRCGTATLHRLEIELAAQAGVMATAAAENSEIVLASGVPQSVPGFISLDDGTTLASERSFTDVELSCEIAPGPSAVLLLKLHLQDQCDGMSNSYHLLWRPENAYVARHHTVLAGVSIPRDGFHQLRFLRAGKRLQLYVDHILLANVDDAHLTAGYCVLSVSHGSVRLRGLQVTELDAIQVAEALAVPASRPVQAPPARGTYPRTPTVPPPFTAMPTRNLIYHIWPAVGSVWRWNIELLLQRIDLFNGRRIVGIVQDAGSEEAGEVEQLLEGHGCESFVLSNGPSGEVVTFPHLLHLVWSDDPNEVTFYGHAKGVKYREAVSVPVRRWTETLYQTTLDEWPAVKAALSSHMVAGSFRKFGRSRAHRNVGEWHYSGTFFWLRHGFLPKTVIDDVPGFYGGVEAWAGKHVPRERSACLFLDDLRMVPYRDEFWRHTGDPALSAWEAKRHTRPPPDLAHPAPFEGFITPRLEQKPEEMAWLMQHFLEAAPCRVLTIGARHGGIEWHLARKFRQMGRTVEITTIEVDVVPQLRSTFDEIRTRWGQSANLIHADSRSDAARQALTGRYDAVFIDGDHSYRGARADWGLATSVGARMVAFHDIVDSDWHASARCCVSRLWRELRANYTTREIALGDWGGIGVVLLRS